MSEPGHRPHAAPTRRRRRRRPGARRSVYLGAIAALVTLLAIAALAVSMSGAGASARRIAAEPTPRTDKPAAPTDLAAVAASGGGVQLVWQPPQPWPVGYRIYRANGLSGSYALIGEVNAPNVTSFTDNVDLRVGETYDYTVTAFNRQQQSAPSGPIMAIVVGVPALTTQSATPTFIAAVPTVPVALPTSAVALPTAPLSSAQASVVPTIAATGTVNVLTPIVTTVASVTALSALGATAVHTLTPLLTVPPPGALSTASATSGVNALTPLPTVRVPGPLATATPRP